MIKKITGILLAAVMSFSLVSCDQNTSNGNSENNSSSEALDSSVVSSEIETETSSEPNEVSEEISSASADKSETDGNILIAYFSWSGAGNTEKMANYLQEQTGGDLLEIEPLNPYPTDYDECGDVALVERDNNERPEIANLPDTIAEYDTVFIGYPIWWHTAPMIIGTFLENYDLSGVEVYPFTQSASMNTEQFENSMDFVRESAQGATVHDGLFVDADDTDGMLAYLTENGFAE